MIMVDGVGVGVELSAGPDRRPAHFPPVRVVGVEPNGADAMSRSLERGAPVHLESVNTIADGLAPQLPENTQSATWSTSSTRWCEWRTVRSSMRVAS
jgi:threonine dehydratase